MKPASAIRRAASRVSAYTSSSRSRKNTINFFIESSPPFCRKRTAVSSLKQHRGQEFAGQGKTPQRFPRLGEVALTLANFGRYNEKAGDGKPQESEELLKQIKIASRVKRDTW